MSWRMIRLWSLPTITLETFSKSERSHSMVACMANDPQCHSPVECTVNDPVEDTFMPNGGPLFHSREECTENDPYPKRHKPMPTTRIRSSEERCHSPVECMDDDSGII
ncbi:unnamed protein product [Caenorhabditis brenneri]